jgi:hypothetical protein
MAATSSVDAGNAAAWGATRMPQMTKLAYWSNPLDDDVKFRLRILPEHTLRGFSDLVDMQALTFLLGVIALYMLMGLLGLFKKRPPNVAAPRLRLASWIVFLGALLGYLALPHHLPAFEIMTFFPRLAPLLVATTLLVIPAGLNRLSGRERLLAPLPALLFCALYGWEIVKHYRLYGTEVSDFMAVVNKMPPGGKLMGLVFDRGSGVMRVESSLLGLPNFYPALKPAPGSMVPLQFCDMRHIPCRKKKTVPMAAVPSEWPWIPDRFEPEKAVPVFDYYIVRSGPPRHLLFGAQSAKIELVHQQGTWQGYRRKKKPPS